MKLFVLFFLIVVQRSQDVPEIWLNLSDDPSSRYDHLFPKYTEGLNNYANEWKQLMNYTEDDLIFFDILAKSHHDQELVLETQAIAKLSGVAFNLLYSMQFMYDFGSAKYDSLFGCTSILVTPPTQKPYIARNLDYSMRTTIKPLLAIVNYYYGDKQNVVMQTMGIVGQLSLTHSITTKFFSITINQLNSQSTKHQLLPIIISNQYNSLIRQVFLIARESTSYKEARQKILVSVVNSHGYIIIVGREKDENAIIHMLDWNQLDNSKIPVREVNISGDSLFIAATNGYDSKDSQNRLSVALERMTNLSNEQLEDPQQIIKNVLSLSPNKNHITIASAILRPLQGDDGVQVILYE